ncbi:MAG: hypothetical protein HOQ11_11210 [Gemmatimonadaceae bacterium]|nr:hypothetical protein [Gemmatimonadaceae bacterium]NUQ92582.1 hypothetical protein [Gemmatimonadaceae bacterium]NUR18606.1 hypothetical protein [Gemmatimonadaceae bacterium]NUS97963.1 hypothetical protein [Gemmatimonadaceae bacterium]
MQQHLRDRILRKLESLSDERGYQVLDYVEFLESRYAERPAPPASIFQRFGDAVEDSLRAGKVSATTISKAMGLMGQAMSVLDGVAAAGKSVASDIAGATGIGASRKPGTPEAGGPAGGAPSAPTSPATPRSGDQTT